MACQENTKKNHVNEKKLGKRKDVLEISLGMTKEARLIIKKNI